MLVFFNLLDETSMPQKGRSFIDFSPFEVQIALPNSFFVFKTSIWNCHVLEKSMFSSFFPKEAIEAVGRKEVVGAMTLSC